MHPKLPRHLFPLPWGPRRASTPVLFALVLGSLAAPAATQLPCPPFAKSGLREISNWGSGQSFTLGDAQCGSAAIGLTFAYDATNGVALQRIAHRGTHSDDRVTRFDFVTVPPPGQSTMLWKAVLRPLDSDFASEITPADASEFRVWVDSTRAPRTAVFRWHGCCVPNTNSRSFFWVEIAVQVSPFAPQRATWSTRMARFENPNGIVPLTIDEVHAPIVYLQQPGDSQKSRILVPVSQNVPLPSSNLAMRSWQLFNLSATLEHPAREQQMQFSALYGGDPTEVVQGEEIISAFRKVLYLSTEDTQGHFKKFKHDIVSNATGTAYYRWCPVYFPAYGPSPALNVFVAPYPVVFCALQARSDAYWYDVGAHYREFVRSGMGMVPIRSPFYRLNREVVDGSVLIATSTLGAFYQQLDDIFETFVDVGRHHQAMFRQPGNDAASPLFMEWQKWLKARATDGEDPVGPGFNPEPFADVDLADHQPPRSARNEIARAQRLGMNVSVYTVPLFIDTDAWSGFDTDWLLRNRLGEVIPVVGLNSFLSDLGNRNTPNFYSDVLYPDILKGTPELGGFFFDLLGGSGSFLRYPKPGTPFFNFKYHGGTEYVDGGKRLFDRVRARIALAKGVRRSHPDVPFLATEGVQEFYAGHYDAAQHGLKPLPLQTQLSTFIDQLTSPGLPPAPVEAQTDDPPLWNLVYHEYSRADALGMMLSTRGVSALLGGGQPVDFGTGKIGLTWEEWGNYNRMVHALMFIQGMKSMLFSYFYDFKDLSLLTEVNGKIGVRDPSVPQQVQLLAFFQRLHESVSRDAEAGQFLNSGVMERPLALPALALGPTGFDPSVVSTSDNPAVPTFERNDPLQGVTKHFYEDVFTQSIHYPVAHVLHSVWRESACSSRLGLVFVNWSDQAATWQAEFDPKLYSGFGDRFEVTGVRPDGARVRLFRVGSGSGKTVLSWNATGPGLLLQHHAANAPGSMPPRSVQVFWIDPVR
ncbi:MAG: hypothetical protein H6837_14990 [Planctomycetes bacterium]|nr:hypothetical protein [Planctomycetota bacterium]